MSSDVMQKTNATSEVASVIALLDGGKFIRIYLVKESEGAAEADDPRGRRWIRGYGTGERMVNFKVGDNNVRRGLTSGPQRYEQPGDPDRVEAVPTHLPDHLNCWFGGAIQRAYRWLDGWFTS